MKRLYHGSNVKIEQIDLSRSKRGKDFGKGFYLNANADQAMEMAKRTTRISNEGKPTLTSFDFDDIKAKDMGLTIKVFPDYTIEWAEFVVMNRNNNSDRNAHSYDELYSSQTFAKLNDPECGLYYQGAVYVFQFLKNEIETGKIA